MRLERLIVKYPGEQPAIERLAQLFERVDRPRAYDIDRLYDIAKPSSKSALLRILYEFVSAGVVEEEVEVRTDAGDIGHFPSVTDIPPVMQDWRTGGQVEVTADNIVVLYKPARGRDE